MHWVLYDTIEKPCSKTEEAKPSEVLIKFEVEANIWAKLNFKFTTALDNLSYYQAHDGHQRTNEPMKEPMWRAQTRWQIWCIQEPNYCGRVISWEDGRIVKTNFIGLYEINMCYSLCLSFVWVCSSLFEHVKQN